MLKSTVSALLPKPPKVNIESKCDMIESFSIAKRNESEEVPYEKKITCKAAQRQLDDHSSDEDDCTSPTPLLTRTPNTSRKTHPYVALINRMTNT